MTGHSTELEPEAEPEPEAAAPRFEVRVAPPHPDAGDFAALDRDRDGPHNYYASLLGADERMRGRVLDVGCGGDYPRAESLREVLRVCRQHDGVEPRPEIENHPGLAERWPCSLEEADVPAGAYDPVFTMWVVEHVDDPRGFLRKSAEALRPGGVLYALTANALHPFMVISRSIQAAGLKGAWRERSERKINAYPAYYRLNRRGAVSAAARAAGFSLAEFHHVPCVQWDRYFPRPLRFLPHLYDRLVANRFRRAAQILIFKLERSDEPTGG